MTVNAIQFHPCRLFLWAITFAICIPVHGVAQSPQRSIQQTESQINDLHGKEKLVAYHQLIDYYNNTGKPSKALRFARRAIDLTETIIIPENKLLEAADYNLKPQTYILAAKAFENREFYTESKEAYLTALRSAEIINNTDQISEAQSNVGRLDTLILYSGGGKKSFLGNTFSDISSAVNKGTSDVGSIATLKEAERNEEEGDYEKAIENYEVLLNNYADLGDWEAVTETRVHIAELHEKLGNYEAALDELQEARTIFDRVDDTVSLDKVFIKIDTLSEPGSESSDYMLSPATMDSLSSASNGLSPGEITEVEGKARDIKTIAEEAERSDDYEKSLYYYKEYMEVEQRITEQKRLQELALLDRAHQIENKDKAILLLTQKEDLIRLELVGQKKSRRNLIIGLALMALILTSLYFLYTNKKRDHKKLGFAYDSLTTAQTKLQVADKRIKQLLSQQISGDVATALITSKDAGKVEKRFVCIMFLDIRDFSIFTEHLKPEEIISYQNSVFAFMLESINKHGGIVNQLLGDGFMATFGAPVSHENDSLNAYKAAREIMQKVSEKSQNGTIPVTRVGIGLHAGDVVTGNVGTEKRMQYSITGNTVIIAARLEQLNKKFGSTLVISKEVYSRLPENLREPVEFREEMVKGRSKPLEVAAFFHGSKLDSPTSVSN